MKECPKCRTENLDDERTCFSCGTNLNSKAMIVYVRLMDNEEEGEQEAEEGCLPREQTASLNLFWASLFLFLTVVGAATKNYWIFSLAPLGVVWTFGFRLFKVNNFFTRLGRTALLCLTLAWVGSWLIFMLA